MNAWTVGDVRISCILELGGPVPGTFLMAEAEPEKVLRHAWLRPDFANDEGRLVLNIQAFVLESLGRRIIVDTCVGNDKERVNPFWNQLQTGFLTDLEAAGFPPSSIDTVLCTHLHVDHVGWNTRLVDGKWVPTFPDARYLFARTEWEHWSKEPAGADGDVLGDSVRPIVEGGHSDLVEADHRLTDEVFLEPTPGHTPGHVSVTIRSRGEQAVITGDMIHHPVQCCEPDWASKFDTDPDQGRQTRRAFLARHAGTDTRIFGTHFAGPVVGHIVSDGDVWRFQA